MEQAGCRASEMVEGMAGWLAGGTGWSTGRVVGSVCSPGQQARLMGDNLIAGNQGEGGERIHSRVVGSVL